MREVLQYNICLKANARLHDLIYGLLYAFTYTESSGELEIQLEHGNWDGSRDDSIKCNSHLFSFDYGTSDVHDRSLHTRFNKYITLKRILSTIRTLQRIDWYVQCPIRSYKIIETDSWRRFVRLRRWLYYVIAFLPSSFINDTFLRNV